MMITKVHGQLGGVTGTVTYDPSNIGGTEGDVIIPVQTLSTGQDQRDAHLKSPDFFDVEKFPNITFKTTKVVKNGNAFDLFGDLAIHGVNKPIMMTAEITPEIKTPEGAYKIGVNAKGTINREEFGMGWNVALEAGGFLVAKEIQLEIDAELERPA